MATAGGITIDISRLLTGLRFAQPTGIERIELGLAKHLSPESGGIALTPIGARGFGAAGRRRVVVAAEAHWEGETASTAEELGPIAAFLRDDPKPFPPPRKSWTVPWSLAPAILGASLRKPGSVIDRDGAYLHANFFRLERPEYFQWLGARPDIRPAFLLYDLLPIQNPHFFRNGEGALHARRIETAARFGRLLITSSQTVADELALYLKFRGLPRPRIESVSLPVDDMFARRPHLDTGLGSAPYFVVCGTIEPRKNHQLLLDAWEEMASAVGRPPKLIIAGRRGWNNQNVFSRLDALANRQDLVLEAASLSTAALSTLIGHASGLLSPSFAEGFGLPVAEALASGTPVIAADTPVYRELWSENAQLIDPTKPKFWADAIIALTETSTSRGLNTDAPHVMDWPGFVQRMESMLDAA